jgi:hypothetical protein
MGFCVAQRDDESMEKGSFSKFSKWIAGMVAATVFTGFATPATAEEGFHGMMRERDLTPLGFMRLDMRPAHAISMQPGSWTVETDVAFQNTWALSPEVEKYLTGLEADGRRRLGEADVQAIRDLPGENYLIDLESSVYDVTVHYTFAENWSGYLVTSAVSYRGGFMDGLIESFHDALGFSSFGRPAVARNRANTVFDLKGSDYVKLDGGLPSGLLDPVLGVRYSARTQGRWNFTFEGAVKVPVAGQRDFLSTGRVDVGLQTSAQYLGARNAFYIDTAAVWYGGGQAPSPQDEQVVPTLVLGYERRLTARTNLNLQGYVSPSLYSRQETELRELRATKYQMTLGVRHRVNSHVWTVGITENLQNLNNTPDIGFQVGYTFVPRSFRPRGL